MNPGEPSPRTRGTMASTMIGLMLLSCCLASNCAEQGHQPGVKTQPSEQPASRLAEPRPETQSEAGRQSPPPATRPNPPEAQTRPEPSKPESTYSNKPPYPVSLFVKSPDEEQPGWLRIEQLVNDRQIAAATGKFPEQNRIYVSTGNVRRIRIHVAHLPLRPNERVILQIDKRGMVLNRNRQYATLELRPNGEWVVVEEKE